MTLQQSPDLAGQTDATCKTCGGAMRLARVDSYPMPRARIEIRTLACAGCGATLQQVQANTGDALSG